MAKKKEQKDMAQEQEQRLNFQQKLIEILELGKKKKNMLEYQEIADFFKDLNLDPEKFEMVIDYLEQNGIDVLKISNDDDVDDDIILDDEDEVEVEKIDLSVPEGVSVEDPVRMYLKEIGKLPLLSADEEIELAQNMEDGAVATEKINVLKGRIDGASEEEKAEIKEEIKTLQRDVDKGADAKKRLAEANLRLVVSIAKRYVGRGMLFLDLIQEGNLGLIKAVEKYGKDEEDRKEIDAIPIELPKEKSELDKIAEYAMSRNIDSVNIKDFSTHDIEVYVREQCDIMEEAATHVENAKAEYEAVTEEYNDIQIMEEAPTQIRDKILSCAETIDNMMVDRRILKSTEHKLSNAAYRRMEAVENEMPGGIKLLKASEDYYDIVKRDLRILEAEQLNLRTDADVLVTRQIKIRRLAKTAIFALAAVFAVFLISMTLVQNDSDTALFIGISLFAAILAVGMFALLKVTERNVIITEIKLNKATALLNKVKIKFINAANTLDYEYTKFGVKSSYELDKKYRLYEEMKKEQIRMLDMTSSLNSAENELENMLKNLGLYSPHIWLGRVRAIINPKEMVEVRHEINTRRYKLRQQIEYNEKRIDEAKENIKKITLSNPAHSDGAMRVIEMYEKRHSRVAK